jgi:mannose-1-phosphate guanylyltransferase
MRALLLAAGLGTRLRPLTETVPKCLVPIHGKPLLDYWFDLLFGSGKIERVLVNTSYLADMVATHVEDSAWCNHIDLAHEGELLGTGGTVLANRDWFQDEAFIVAHGDNLTDFDVDAFIEQHHQRPNGSEITMMTFETDTPETCGIVTCDEQGLIVGFHEKIANPPSNNANGAVYIFEPSVLKFLEGLGKSVIDLSTEVLPHYLGRMSAFANDGYHRDIGNLESLALANKEFTPRGQASRRRA